MVKRVLEAWEEGRVSLWERRRDERWGNREMWEQRQHPESRSQRAAAPAEAEDAAKGPQPRGGQAPEAGGGGRRGVPLRVSGGNPAARTLTLAPGDPCPTSNLQQSNLIDSCAFKPLSLW